MITAVISRRNERGIDGCRRDAKHSSAESRKFESFLTKAILNRIDFKVAGMVLLQNPTVCVVSDKITKIITSE